MLSLALLLVAGLAAASADSLPQLDGGYLPPPLDCPAPQIVTKYSTSYVTKTQVRPVVQTDLRIKTQQVYSTRVVPSEIVKEAVQDVPTYVYRTKVVTQTRVEYRTKVVQLPGQTRYVEQPVNKYEEQVVPKEVVVTQTTTLVQPQTSYRTRIVTKYKVETQYVPQYTTIYSTVYGPGPTKYITKTRQVIQTRVQQVPSPAVYRTKYETIYSTAYRTVQIPGPTVTKSQVVYQTKVQYQTQVQYQTKVATQTVPQQIPREVYVTRTQYATQVQTQARYSTQVVPQYYTKTQVVDVPRDVTVTNTRVITQEVPAYPVIKTVYRTSTAVQTVPGGYRQETRVQYVTSTKVVPVTSTRVVPQYQTTTVTETAPCGGYRYDAPSNPLTYGK